MANKGNEQTTKGGLIIYLAGRYFLRKGTFLYDLGRGMFFIKCGKNP